MSSTDTPLMQQWREIKARHPDSLVFFRVGDFYELFFEDAEVGAKLLDITLTSRNNGSSRAPLAGVPVHALDQYLHRLVKAGKRVAICEQVEDASEAKGLVRREVVETVTPGTVLSDNLLDRRRNNFLVALAGDPSPGGRIGIAAADLSTGDFIAILADIATLEDELGRIEPSELLIPRSWELLGELGFVDAPTTYRPEWLFESASGRDELLRHFKVLNLDGFGLPADPTILGAAGALVGYLNETQPSVSSVLAPPKYIADGSAMALDEMTRRNLELVEPLTAGTDSRTLLDVIDRTLTPMGARLCRQWLLSPLLNVGQIQWRQDAISDLVLSGDQRARLRRNLREIRDLERLAVKIASGRSTPRELASVRTSLEAIPDVLSALEGATGPLGELAGQIDPLKELTDFIAGAVVDDPPLNLTDGGVIRDGFNSELDELREIREHGVDWIASMQASERERTGINSLKVGFNKVFGYYLEITRANLDRVPEEYQRRQTLTNAERYITPALKEWEDKILGAEDRITALESRLFGEVRDHAASHMDDLRALAGRIATLDVLCGLAESAVRQEFVRPKLNGGFEIEIRGGRHPVVETMMPREEFIPNDISLDRDSRVIILTGPNMAGKSTVLRQVGLICILAQIGSYVPALSANLAISDRIFTRVGASDNLARGRSTFMVEMTETAAILNGATDRSLVLLDEIGRGTSTWDGLSVATAVTEHLHDKVGAKTIFATHYHELTELGATLEGVVNYSVAVREVGDSIVFVRSLVKGGADRSYGVEVARLAGLPSEVIDRARTLLAELEATSGSSRANRPRPSLLDPDQLGLFPAREHPVLQRLRELDPNRVTPMEALAMLAELKNAAEV